MPQKPMQETEAQRTSRALAEAANEAEERQADETEPGGVYIVNGEKVDAEGKPIGKKD
jgi:hypothetical protein